MESASLTLPTRQLHSLTVGSDGLTFDHQWVCWKICYCKNTAGFLETINHWIVWIAIQDGGWWRGAMEEETGWDARGLISQ